MAKKTTSKRTISKKKITTVKKSSRKVHPKKRIKKAQKVTTPEVSIVIPSYNSAKHIQKCLHALSNQITDVLYEIIVVDSSNTNFDRTQEIIKTEFPHVKLFSQLAKTLPGKGRNIGVLKAKGNIIMFIDSDCVASPNWIEIAYHSFINTTNTQGPCIIGGAELNGNPQTLTSLADYILTFNEFMPSMPARNVTFMPTCNMIFAKETYNKVGGINPELAAGEDTLFCYTALQKSIALVFNPEMQIAHYNRESLKSFVKHHFNFGKHSAKLRKQLPLPGKIFVKFPLLALLVPFARLFRIKLRMLRYNLHYFPRFVIASPLIALGLKAWSIGFIIEAFKSGDKK